MTRSKPQKIACMGEVMIELIAQDNGKAKIGVAGDTYNTAVYLSRLSNPSQLQVSYLTALGTDHFSAQIVSEIEAHGICSSNIEKRDGRMPGLYAINTDEHGERSFSYWRGESAARTLFQEPCTIKPDVLMEFDYVYMSGISMAILPRETRSRLIGFLSQYKKNGGKLVFDSNYRPRLWEDVETAQTVTMQMWSLTDIALPSMDDEMQLFGDRDEHAILKRLVKAGVKTGALKRGLAGPYPIGENVTRQTYTPVTNVVDTTAAGDSFNAGFMLEFALGKSLEAAMLKGHELASRVIRQKGAIIDFDAASTKGDGHGQAHEKA